MSNPARDEHKTTDYRWVYTDRYGSSGGSTTVESRIDQASLTLKNSAAMQARRRGEAAWLNPLYYRRNVERDEIKFGYNMYYDLLDPRYNRSYIGYMDPGQPADPTNPTDRVRMWNDAERKALQKLKNSHVNFAQFFAEAGQAASLYASTATTLAKAVAQTKKGNLTGALKALGYGTNNRQRRNAARLVRQKGKQITEQQGANLIGPTASKNANQAAGHWLAMSFGWGPHVQDLFGTAELLAERATQDNKRTRFSVRAVAKESYKFRNTVPGWTQWTYFGDYTVGALVRLDFYFSSVQLASLSADGLTNPAALAWELTPYSFLFDQVSGLGEWLSNLDASVGKEFVGGSATLFRKFTSTTIKRTVVQTPYDLVNERLERSRSGSYMERFPYTSFPEATMIALAIRNPLKSRLKIANSTAVMVVAAGSLAKS